MKNSNFSIPKNIRHASGVFFAKDLAEHSTIAVLIILAFVSISITLHQGFSLLQELIPRWFCVAVLLIMLASIAGYFVGRKNIKKYLKFLKKKCNKAIKDNELNKSQIDQQADQKVLIFQSAVKEFFTPFINNYVFIDTTVSDPKRAMQELNKAQNAFTKKLLEVKRKFLVTIGMELHNTLSDKVANAIFDKKVISFDVDQWIDTIDFSVYRRNMHKKVSAELVAKQLELKNYLKEIDQLMVSYSEKISA